MIDLVQSKILQREERLPKRTLRHCAFGAYCSIFLFLLATEAHSQQKEVTQVTNLTVQRGKSVHLGSGFWSTDYETCAVSELNMETIIKPEMGRIAAKMISGTIPATIIDGSTNSKCVGLPIKALRLTYTANKTASGHDRILVRTQALPDRTFYNFDYLITIE